MKPKHRSTGPQPELPTKTCYPPMVTADSREPRHVNTNQGHEETTDINDRPVTPSLPRPQNNTPQSPAYTEFLGISCITQPTVVRPDGNQPDAAQFEKQGRTRLLQILISEASHLIWVLRCEKVIRGKAHSNQEISARWKKRINDRLTTDRITATKIKRDLNYTQLIDETWKMETGTEKGQSPTPGLVTSPRGF